jgi:hypothetical protein
MPTIDEIEECGWMSVEGVNSAGALLELARSIGNPLCSSNGEIVRELRVTPAQLAKPLSLSATFGTNSFPLHTDTAFWGVPARFLVMRVAGDTRRPTTVCPIRELFGIEGSRLRTMAYRSSWVLRMSAGSIYSQMVFRSQDGRQGFRYDRQCMKPANVAAKEVGEYISEVLPLTSQRQIQWSCETAVVIANWHTLHGRGPEPPQEQERILQRIYVE